MVITSLLSLCPPYVSAVLFRPDPNCPKDSVCCHPVCRSPHFNCSISELKATSSSVAQLETQCTTCPSTVCSCSRGQLPGLSRHSVRPVSSGWHIRTPQWSPMMSVAMHLIIESAIAM